MEIVLQQFTNFMNSLDWVYIFSFILITYVLQYYKVPEFIGSGLGIKLQKKYQVLLIGLVYAVIVFFVRGYEVSKVLCLFISFFFATVFHKFLLEVIFEKYLPKMNTSVEEEL